MQDLKLDVKEMLIELNDALNNDYTVLDDEQLDDVLAKIIYKEEKLVFNLIDWSLSKLHLVTPMGLKYINDLRNNLTTMTPAALESIDSMAPLTLEVVTKLDKIDTSKRLADVLLKALSV